MEDESPSKKEALLKEKTHVQIRHVIQDIRDTVCKSALTKLAALEKIQRRFENEVPLSFFKVTFPIEYAKHKITEDATEWQVNKFKRLVVEEFLNTHRLDQNNAKRADLDILCRHISAVLSSAISFHFVPHDDVLLEIHPHFTIDILREVVKYWTGKSLMDFLWKLAPYSVSSAKILEEMKKEAYAQGYIEMANMLFWSLMLGYKWGFTIRTKGKRGEFTEIEFSINRKSGREPPTFWMNIVQVTQKEYKLADNLKSVFQKANAEIREGGEFFTGKENKLNAASCQLVLFDSFPNKRALGSDDRKKSECIGPDSNGELCKDIKMINLNAIRAVLFMLSNELTTQTQMDIEFIVKVPDGWTIRDSHELMRMYEKFYHEYTPGTTPMPKDDTADKLYRLQRNGYYGINVSDTKYPYFNLKNPSFLVEYAIDKNASKLELERFSNSNKLATSVSLQRDDFFPTVRLEWIKGYYELQLMRFDLEYAFYLQFRRKITKGYPTCMFKPADWKIHKLHYAIKHFPKFYLELREALGLPQTNLIFRDIPKEDTWLIGNSRAITFNETWYRMFQK